MLHLSVDPEVVEGGGGGGGGGAERAKGDRVPISACLMRRNPSWVCLLQQSLGGSRTGAGAPEFVSKKVCIKGCGHQNSSAFPPPPDPPSLYLSTPESKEGTAACTYYTWHCISQLSTNNLSINKIPEVITHCAPGIIVADLHTSSGDRAPLKSDVSLGAGETPHSSIFNVCARIDSKTRTRAGSESGLSSTTHDI